MQSSSPTVVDSIRQCAHEVASYVDANGGDPTKARGEVIASIKRLLARPDLLTVGLPRPAVNVDSSMILYYDPKLMLVMGYTKGGGQYDPPHNHGSWLATGVYRGEVEYADYRRVDDQTRPGYAELEIADRALLRAGDVGLTPCPPHDIHSTKFLTEGYTLIVIGGGFASSRIYYDMANKSYVERATG